MSFIRSLFRNLKKREESDLGQLHEVLKSSLFVDFSLLFEIDLNRKFHLGLLLKF